MRITLIRVIILVILIVSCSNNQTPLDGKSFLDRVASIEKMELGDRIKAADILLDEIAEVGTPLYIGNNTAILVARYDQDSLVLTGDMNRWQGNSVFKRIDGTDLHYHQGEYEPNARLQYWLQRDPKVWPVVDSLNPFKVTNGFGAMSELVMPGYEYNPVFAPFRDGQTSSLKGLDEHIIAEGVLPYTHNVHVWTPPDHLLSEVVGSIYLLDGAGYVSYAHMPTVLDALVKSGKIQPVIAVFVTPPNYEGSGEFTRETEYGMNPDFVKFMSDELVPYIDSKYSTGGGEAKSRLVLGDSYGGLGALYTAFLRPDVFGLAYSQSGYVSFHKDSLITFFRESEKLNLKLALDIGTYETQIGSGYVYKREADFLTANRRMRDCLIDQGYEIYYEEYPEGHTWGNWRQHLTVVLPWFYGQEML